MESSHLSSSSDDFAAPHLLQKDLGRNDDWAYPTERVKQSGDNGQDRPLGGNTPGNSRDAIAEFVCGWIPCDAERLYGLICPEVLPEGSETLFLRDLRGEIWLNDSDAPEKNSLATGAPPPNKLI